MSAVAIAEERVTTGERVMEFVLPSDLEAHEPPEARGVARDQVRLLVSFRDSDRMIHARFSDLPDFLRPGDLLVVNDSATLPAALTAHRRDGTAIALHLSTRLPGGLWVVEPRRASVSPGENPGVHISEGEQLALSAGGVATFLASYADSLRLWIARLDLPEDAVAYLQRWGRPITYPYIRGQWPIAMYQTMFAREPGSAEMPSAGRPFTPNVITELKWAGVGLATITLHTGVASLERGEPQYEEAYTVPHATAEAIRAAKFAGGGIIAVGTTVVRALESALDDEGRVIASRGWTDLVVTPERGVKVVDGLLTGFHEPKSTHLELLAAIARRDHVLKAYRAALDAGYLWHEFGDAHLLLPRETKLSKGKSLRVTQ